MVVIRLSRGGSKKAPFYQIVATDSRNSRDGRFIEKLGYYNPIARGKATSIDLDQSRFDYWLDKGAQMSERVSKVLKEYKKGNTQADMASSSQIRKEQAAKAETDARLAKEKAAKEAETDTAAKAEDE